MPKHNQAEWRPCESPYVLYAVNIGNMKLKIAGTIKNSIVDGDGIRYVVFAQGCEKRCKHCHNPHTHDKNGGYIADTEELAGEIVRDRLLSGVTFSGGEPFLQAKEFAHLANLLPRDLSKYVYSGYLFEELLEMGDDVRTLLCACDRLIDGEFIERETDVSLLPKFKGSGNQRIINLKQSMCEGRTVLAE
ncbi:anaerobic ribonucleoside-triphosphate reductase-activating protein [Clostridia bacterium]|nr:anaerobic ribonucleoside-triphosphate reductase-activating protein [Clostridia bacterium]